MFQVCTHKLLVFVSCKSVHFDRFLQNLTCLEKCLGASQRPYFWHAPAIAAFTAVGFFGLDQVGVELEGPFGVDENDFPLLSMGHEMANDLDAMARTVSRSKMEARVQSYTLEESMGMARAADAVLGWASLPVETLAAEDSVISLSGGDVEPKE